MPLLTARPRRRPLAALALVGASALLAGCAGQTAPAGVAEAPAAASSSAAAAPEAIATPRIEGVLDQAAADLLPADVAEAGTLEVAGGPGYPPFYLLADDQTTLVGADPEIVRAIGDVLGVEVTFTDIKFDALIPSLQTGRVEMAAGGFGITEERLQVVDFVSSFSGGTSLIVPTGNPLGIGLDTMCGRTVAVQKGTIYADDYMPDFTAACEAAGEEPIEITVFPTQPDANLALTSGRADASMSDYGPLAYIAERSNGQLEVLQENYEPATWGFAFTQGSDLEEPVAAAMNALIADGTYGEILEKWGVSDGAITESEIFTADAD